MAALIIAILVAYLLGSVPTGFILSKLFGKSDIRGQGSGNIGATNVYRVAGKSAGILTLFIDVAKGAVATGVFSSYFYGRGVPLEFGTFRMIMALAAVAGHNWTPFLHFKGGKGVATSVGALLVLCPKILGFMVLVWGIVFAVTRIVSLASIVASVAFPLFVVFLGDFKITLFSVILCIFSIFKHRANLSRLIQGSESRLKL